MNLKTSAGYRFAGLNLIALLLATALDVQAADQFFAGDGTALNTAKWSLTAGGPYADTFTNNNVANFAVVNGTGTGGTITVSGINATENFTISTIGGTIGAAAGINPVTVSAGKLFDASTQLWASGATAGFSMNGGGVWATAGNTFGGGFVLNSGTVIARGVNAFGGNATPGPLTINGGAIGADLTRNFASKYSGITIGGDFQIGVLASAVSISSDTANLAFANNVALGGVNRTITIGANGVYTFSGIISSTGAGLIVTNLPGATGGLTLSGANTFSGGLQIQGGQVIVSSAGNAFSGGITISSGAYLQLLTAGSVGGNPITNNGVMSISLTGTPTVGNLISGSGSLLVTNLNGSSQVITLTNVNTFTGGTTLNGAGVGTVLLNSPGICLPGPITNLAGKIKLGAGEQIADTAIITYGSGSGRLQLQGFNETIGGVQDFNETPVTGSRILEAASDGIGGKPGTLTLNVSGTEVYSFGGYLRDAALTNNSPLSVIKSGTGTQILRGTNSLVSYTGPTVIDNGVLEFSGTNSVANGSAITINGGSVKFSGGGLRSNVITGAGSLIAAGNTLILSGTNTYSGSTTVSSGTLAVSGSLAGGAVTVNAGGTLAALGTIGGAVTVGASGILAGKGGTIGGAVTLNNSAILSPGNAASDIGPLSISNTLTLNAGSVTFMELDQTGNTNDQLRGISTLSYGGTLIVTNVGGTFVGGESYQLFSATTYNPGNFAATNLPALDSGLKWVWTPASGTLAVAMDYATTPTNLVFNVSGTNLSLTWPGSHLGWYAQSNSVDIADTNYWINIPGSTTVTNLDITIDPAQPNVFYRLKML